MKIFSVGIEFHHIGIACNNIEKEKKLYQLLGYSFEQFTFEDENQGIKGIFGNAQNQPCIELLQDLEHSYTLKPFLDKGIKMYHFGYIVNDFEKACFYMEKIKAKIVSPPKESQYFGKRICFYILSNMMIIELIEKNTN